ncbi:lipocalin family protein [Myroides phaeus]|uniref:lipocalin family protein n=1 Tax=Myroides phaeus TaxID=702745 RepID=UPI002DB5CD75|nr:lipocalin family protein [Myroides phaeus]MEC4116298.1 lipocalin family protein [Myroides phaeus]
MKKIHLSLLLVFSAVILLFSSCQQKAEQAQPIENFEVKRYLGNWYEIARFDFKFEKDLNNTTANYSLNEDGTIRVVNKGYNPFTEEWKVAEGKAKFVGEENIGQLKVSFFGPFYSGYNILALDENYQFALIGGKDLDYLWILSRAKTIPDTIKEEYLKIAERTGYDTSRLLWIEHNK